VRALAARHSITLAAGAATASGGSSSAWSDRAKIAGGALVLCALGFAGYGLARRRSHG
jgi:hypothetical protein